MGFLNFLGGVERQLNPFDNNATYKNPVGNGQTKSTLSQVKDSAIGLGKGLVAPEMYFLNTDIVNPVKQLWAQAKGDKVAYQNADIAENKLATPRKLIGNTAQLGMQFLAPGISNAAEAGVTGAVGAVAPRFAENAVAKTALGVGGELLPKGLSTGIGLAAAPLAGAAIGAPFNVTNTIAGDEPLTRKNIVQSAKSGAETGAALGLGTAVLGEGVNLAKNAKPLDQVGGGDITDSPILNKLKQADTPAEVKTILEGKLDQTTIDKIANPIAKASDPVVINDIISSETSKQAPPIVPSTEAPATLRDRGFLKTIQEGGPTTPEARANLADLPQQYEQAHNPAQLETARQLIADNPDKVRANLFDTERKLTAEDNIASQLLLEKAIKAGDAPSQVRIAEALTSKLTEAGQATQASAIWDRLDPNAVVLKASKTIGKAREGGMFEGKVAQESGVAQGLKGAVENTDKISVDKPAVDTMLKGIVSDVEAEQKSVGEKVAGNIERTVDPKIKKQADQLVTELTKKIKQEELAPATKVPKSPISILREVFGRTDEAMKAYPEAQQILKEKFADNPKVLAVLDKFFNSELKLPAANSTINNAIAEQLKANGTSISKIILDSWDSQKNSVADITQSLVKSGFDEVSAKSLAEEVNLRLSQQVNSAKANALAEMAKPSNPRAVATLQAKIEKLSNLGALDNKDYLELARAKLKIPDLSAESAGKISKLAQEMQTLPDGYEKYQLMQQIHEEIRSNIPRTYKDVFRDLITLPKAILASTDVSFGGRQGAVLASRFPDLLGKAELEQFRGFTDTGYHKELVNMGQSAEADVARKMGVDFADPNGIFKEEAFRSVYADKIPGVAQSDRMYTLALSKVRLGAVKKVMDSFERAGIDINTLDKKGLEDFGKAINTATGRGMGKSGGWFEKAAPVLNDTLFSPRLWKSRLDMLNPTYYKGLEGGGKFFGASNTARRLAVESSASFAAIATVVLGLAAAAGAQVETDARSSDFGKIKVGDTRYDILGGFGQNIVLATRLATGEKKSSVSGAVTKLDTGKYGSANRLSVLSDFLQNKENPVLGFVQNEIKGTDKSGAKLNRFTDAGRLFVPLSIQDTAKATGNASPDNNFHLSNLPKGLLKATVPGVVGIGVGTYGAKDINPTTKQQVYLAKLKKAGASNDEILANKSFFQTIKDGPSRTEYNNKINSALTEYLKTGDKQSLAQAQQIAKEYNQKYSGNFTKWTSKNNKYANTTLVKTYNAGKIKLDATSIRARLKTIKGSTV